MGGTSMAFEARIALQMPQNSDSRRQSSRPLLALFSKRRLTAVSQRTGKAPAHAKRFTMGPLVRHSQSRLTDLRARGLPVKFPSTRSLGSRSLIQIKLSRET